MKRLLLTVILAVITAVCAYGQEPATGEMTVTQAVSLGSENYIVGTDNEKELKTSTNVLRWFDTGISVTNAMTEYALNSDGTVSRMVFVVNVTYQGKPYVVKIAADMKLRYRLAGENVIILYDEAYFSPENEQP